MGIFKNIIEKRKNEVETSETTSLAYDDELRQIYDNYCQGFLSQEEYDFQTGLYKKWSNDGMTSNVLHVVDKGTFGDEDLYNISINVARIISNRFTESKESDADFYWLKCPAIRPCFHHLCFTYKKTVYSCLIGVIMDNGEVWIGPEDAENFFLECINNCLYPCIIPVSQSGDLFYKHAFILDAETLQPINFDEQEEFVSPIMTNYEMHARAINEIAFFLMDRGCTNISTCDIMSISPSVFFNDEDGNHSYIVVRSLPAGLDGISYCFNKGLVDFHKDHKGYFVNFLWNNLDGNNGNFMDTQIIKNGSYVHNNIELEPLDPIEMFEMNHPNFTFVNEKLSSVQNNDDSIVNEDVWDSSLEEISKQEKIRYKIYKRYGELKSGDRFGLEDVFGKDGVSADEYIEFLKVMEKISSPYPFFNTPEELHEAESNVKEDEYAVMYKIANTYMGVKEFGEAIKWYSKAAELGCSDAICRLAGSYKHGNGVEYDMGKAIRLYKKAIVVDGNGDALLDLGLCYLKGEGVPRNDIHGFSLMVRSAKQGNMMAQYNLGVLYRTGRGVLADMDTALYWYKLSAEQGYEQAIEFLEQRQKLS